MSVDHDPQCPRHESNRDPVWGFGATGECQCALIARVRADERERMRVEVWEEVLAPGVFTRLQSEARAAVAEEIAQAIEKKRPTSRRKDSEVTADPLALAQRAAYDVRTQDADLARRIGGAQ